MSTLTVRLPDETADRLKALARHRGISVNKLIAELSTQAIAAWDTETRFRAMAARADRDAALAVLDRLDRTDGDG
jgi:predicted transcriptional regulator